MQVRIGDIVRSISEKMEGKVTGVIDHQTVNVYCEEYGFEIPASVNDLVVIHTDFKPAHEQATTNAPAPGQKAVNMQSANTLYVAFVPSNFNDLPGSHFDLYLVNDTRLTALYTITFQQGERYTGVAAGNAEPDHPVPLGTYSLKEIDAVNTLLVQAIFYQKGNCSPRPLIDARLKINAPSLCKGNAYTHTRWFSSVALIRPLDKESLAREELVDIDPKQLFQAKKEKTEPARHEETPPRRSVNDAIEIDLHIDSLLETTAGMENRDMLEYQMNVFRQTLETYKMRPGQKIVFIHGKGDGVLRQRILWELQTQYKRFHHQDASFKQYGYGATLVTIK